MDYHRHTIRLRKDTYSHPGIYFVTIGSIKHVCIFGEIINNCFLINNLGKIVLDNYQKLSQRFKNIKMMKLWGAETAPLHQLHWERLSPIGSIM